MNLCFIIGKVLEDAKFEFLYNDKRISIAYTILRLRNNTEIQIKGYGKVADIMYRDIKKNDFIYIRGRLLNNKEIEILSIKRL